MRFAGVDVASETHVVAVVDERGEILVKPTVFGEDAEGHAKLLSLLGAPGDVLVAMEATGHYWKNLFAALAAGGFPVALINPLRTHRFAAQKHPPATRLPDQASLQLPDARRGLQVRRVRRARQHGAARPAAIPRTRATAELTASTGGGSGQ